MTADDLEFRAHDLLTATNCSPADRDRADSLSRLALSVRAGEIAGALRGIAEALGGVDGTTDPPTMSKRCRSALMPVYAGPADDEEDRPRYVVTPTDNGIDGMAPTRYYGDDIGPFDTRQEAEAHMRDLEKQARDEGNFYARWSVREVTSRAVRWQ